MTFQTRLFSGSMLIYQRVFPDANHGAGILTYIKNPKNGTHVGQFSIYGLSGIEKIIIGSAQIYTFQV